MEVFKIIVLSLSGLLLFFVGLMRLTNPLKAYKKNSGIEFTNDVNVLNELRGSSAVQMFAGIIVLLGIVLQKVTLISFCIAILYFIGFALGRLLSFSSDGKPNKLIVQGLWFEIVFGITNLACLYLTWN